MTSLLSTELSLQNGCRNRVLFTHYQLEHQPLMLEHKKLESLTRSARNPRRVPKAIKPTLDVCTSPLLVIMSFVFFCFSRFFSLLLLLDYCPSRVLPSFLHSLLKSSTRTSHCKHSMRSRSPRSKRSWMQCKHLASLSQCSKNSQHPAMNSIQAMSACDTTLKSYGHHLSAMIQKSTPTSP